MTWPTYPDYRETDVDWIGLTPSSWSIERLSWLFNDISSGTTPESGNLDYYDGDINWVTTGELREKGIAQTEKRVTPSALVAHSALKVYPAGTLLIAMYGATIGRLGWLDTPACTNQACCAFANPKRVSTRFAYYALSAARNHLITLASGGGQPNINQDKLRSLRIAVPSRSEQAAITDFLDRETVKIDALIGKQEQLIATLREDRTTTITRAVTRGLDPGVKKERLGLGLPPQPVHWTLAPVKRFLRSLDHRRIPLSTVERGLRQGEFPYYGASGVIDHVDDFLFDEDLVLVSEDGANLLGRRTPIAFVATGRYWVNNHAHILQPLDTEAPQFWAHRIEAENLTPWITGSAQPKFTVEALMNLPISAPPTKGERAQIVAYLEQACGKVDALIAKASEMIAVMREYRSALVTDAVTGKIDVRGTA